MSSEQQLLFDLGPIDFRRVREVRERILNAGKAANSLRTYASSWKAFTAWCTQAGRQALPASVETVECFISWSINEKFRVATLEIRICAIRHYHALSGYEMPGGSAMNRFLHNAKRDLKETPVGRAALTPAHLRRIARKHFNGTPLQVRDWTMILLGFAAGWRRSEIAGLQLSDVKFVRRGVTLWLPSSKTDQIGEGRSVAIQQGEKEQTCPVRTLRKWLAFRGDWDGPLFVRFTPRNQAMTHRGISRTGDRVYEVVKRSLEEIGVDPTNFGAHSLRAGMITAAAEAGATELSIMMRTGHRQSASLRQYIRPIEAFRLNPLAGVL